MARSRLSLKRSLLLASFVLVSFSAAALAADDSKSTAKNQPAPKEVTTTEAKPNQPTNNQPTTTQPAANQPTNENKATTTVAAVKSTPSPQDKPTTTTQPKPATTASPQTSQDAQTSKEPPTSAAASSTAGPTTGVITATGKNTDTAVDPLPTIGTSTASTDKIDLPTLPVSKGGVPNYPAPTVPPTKDAPFMQHSTLPDGTVFIAVGSILGGLGVALLIWRAVVAYLLHRSIARASLAQHSVNDKSPFVPPPGPFYKYSDHDSSFNLGAPGGSVASGRGVRRTNRGPTPSSTPSMTNLFFSPTAPGANGMGTAGNRDSRLLPSGFYAAGSASPAGHGQAIGLSNLRPDGATARNTGPSPPESPSFGPMRTTPLARNNMSSSSVNLNRPASGRAPSAFLDDLLDDQPHLFPPGASNAPTHQHTHSQSTQSSRRY